MGITLLQLQFPNSRIFAGRRKCNAPALSMPAHQRGTRLFSPVGQPRVIYAGCSVSENDNTPAVLHPTFAVVDNFLTKTVDSDGDGKGELSHGEVVEAIIKAKCPGAVVKRQGLLPLGEGELSYSDLIANLKGVKKASDWGTQFYGVNISSEATSNFEQASKVLNQKVTSENIADKKAQLREKLNDDQQELMQSIEALEEQGIPVYIAAGNNGQAHFNAMSLTNKAKTVGATDVKGNEEDYSAKNSLVSTWAQGTYSTVAVKDKDGKILGFNLTGGNQVQLPVNGTPPPSQCEEKLKLIDTLGIEIDKDDEHFQNSENLLDYISKKYKDEGCKAISNKRCDILSEINNDILGFDSFKLMLKVQKAILEPNKELTNKAFINKYIDKLEDMETLRYVKFDKEGKPFFDFDGSGRNAFGVIAGTSFAAPAAMVRDFLDQQKTGSKDLAEGLTNGFPPEEVFKIIE